MGSLPRLVLDQFQFLERSCARKGQVFELDLGVTRVVVVADPTAVERVMVTNARNFDKGEVFWDVAREVLGQGLAMSEGELWRRQRKLMQPELQRSLVLGYRGTIIETIEKALPSLVSDGPIDLGSWSDKLIATLSMRILFGTDLDPVRIDELRTTMASVFDLLLIGLVTRKLPRWLPVIGRRRLARARQMLDENVMSLIVQRRHQPGDGTDLFGILLRAADESGLMSDQQLRDEAVTLYVGGYEATGTALAWTLWLLATHPRIRDELQTELDGGSDDRRLLRACLQEGMRLYPPAPFLPRRAVADDVLGGHRVRAGSTVLVSPWLLHRNPEVWPRPTVFDPGRFMAPGHAAKPQRSWLPFGAGHRICIGKALAMLELEEALRLVLARFEPTVAEGAPPPRPRLSTSLRSSTGILVRMVPR